MGNIGRTLAIAWGFCLASWALRLAISLYDSPVLSRAFVIAAAATGLMVIVLLAQIVLLWWRRHHLA